MRLYYPASSTRVCFSSKGRASAAIFRIQPGRWFWQKPKRPEYWLHKKTTTVPLERSLFEWEGAARVAMGEFLDKNS